jgi:hypothetical protein
MTETVRALYGIAVGFVTTGAVMLSVAAIRIGYFPLDEGEGVDIGAAGLLTVGPVVVGVGLLIGLIAALIARPWTRLRSNRNRHRTQQRHQA